MTPSPLRSTLLHRRVLPALALAALAACGGAGDSGGPRFAYVTNGVDPFWNVAGAGARAAAAEFGVDVDLVFPEGGAVDQKQKLEDLMVRGVDGIAVAVIDGKNMSSFLDDVAGKTHLITHDSDAPASKRRCFEALRRHTRETGILRRISSVSSGASFLLRNALSTLSFCSQSCARWLCQTSWLTSWTLRASQK